VYARRAAYYKNLTLDEHWTAGSDIGCEGKFTWCSNNSLPVTKSELNWAPGTPNLDGDCLFIKTRDNQTLIANGNCEEEKKFFCEAVSVSVAAPDTLVQQECRAAFNLNSWLVNTY